MDDTSPQKLVSLDDLVAEVQALHSRVSQLERELARVRIETTVPRGMGRDHVGDAAPVHVPLELAGARVLAGSTPDSPVRQVLTADEDTARQHLERLRASITRLREERARASAEFRLLTHPRAAEESPAEPEAAVLPAPLAVEAPGPAELAPPVPPPMPREAPDAARATSDVPAAAPPVATLHRPVPSGDAERGGPLDMSASFPTLAAARQALDGVLARDTTGARATPETPTDEAWRQVRTSVLDAESERSYLRRRRFTGVAAVLGWVVLIGAAALTINWLRHRADQAPAAAANEQAPSAESAPLTPTESPPMVVSAAPEAAPGGAAPAAAVAPPTAPAGPVGTTGNGAAAPRARVELHTTREVWMRTRVDERAFRERLVPANQVLEFNPARTFYVRAGDAGGLRVVIDGEDRGLIGDDGRVVARTFSIPPRPDPR